MTGRRSSTPAEQEPSTREKAAPRFADSQSQGASNMNADTRTTHLAAGKAEERSWTAVGSRAPAAAPAVMIFSSPPTPVSTEADRAAARESTDSDPEQKRLQAHAGALRSRLAQTLDSLSQRKQAAVDATHALISHPLPYLLAGAGVLLTVIGGSWLLARRARSHKKKSRRVDRLHALGELWQHPERRSHPYKGSLIKEVGRGAVVSASTYVLTELAKHGIAKLSHRLQGGRRREA